VTSVEVWLLTFALSLTAGVVPLVSLEAALVGLIALRPETDVLPAAIAASLGQMFGKSLLYVSGAGIVRLPGARSRSERAQRLVAEVRRRLASNPATSLLLVAASACTGVPPLYAVALAAGALRLGFRAFFAAGFAGALVRFGAILAVARLY
jgi:membrane protein YqaA with SNARE-associated domain